VSDPQPRFQEGERAEVIGSENVFVTVRSNGGKTGVHLVQYIGIDERAPRLFKHESDMRHLDESLHHHFNALLSLAELLGDDKLTRVLEYAAHHVKRAADAIPTTDKEAS
jgi:hypothetical protein